MNLAEHKIIEVKGGYIRNRWPRLLGKNGRCAEHGYGYDINITIVKTDTGFTGWGIGMPDRTLKVFLEGARLSDVFSVEKGVCHKALTGADMALHDLAGQILSMPVTRLLDPNSTMQAPVYDGGIYMNDLLVSEDKGIDVILRGCRQDYQMGYRDFKIKIGRGRNWMGWKEGLKRDIEVVRAVRKEFPESKILVDANDALDLNATIELMEGIKDCDIYWIEEAFRENYEDCKALKEYLMKNSPQTMIADGEFEYEIEQVEDLARNGYIDVLIMDPESYGFTGWRRKIEACQGTKVKCSPHGWGTAVKTNALTHLAAAFPSVVPILEGAPDVMVDGVNIADYAMNDGIVTIPDKPGFGMELEYANPMPIFKPY